MKMCLVSVGTISVVVCPAWAGNCS